MLTGLAAGLTGAVLAPAQTQGLDNRRHLLLVPDTAKATAALARTDARVVAEYESFSLVEARGRDDQRLRRAGAERRDDMRTVETAAGRIDPAAVRRLLAGKEAPDRDEVLALVQFIGPPKEAWLERLRATGARIVTYQAENAYVVHARGRAVDRLAALQGGDPAVRAVGVLTVADKVEDRASRSGTFAITTVVGAAGREARDEAAQAGPPSGAAPVTVGTLRTEYRRVTAAQAFSLASDPGVVAIEAYSAPELSDERAAQIVAGNLTAAFAPTTPTYLGWLLDPARIPDSSTFGFAIDVTDEGLDNGAIPTAHNDFRDLGVGTSRVAYQADYTSDPDARDCGGHGTNVASIATGYNAGAGAPQVEDSSGYNHGLGVAPFSRVGASKIFECDGDFSTSWTPSGLTAAAYASGARISNNSWGTGNDTAWGDYSARSAAYDQLVRDARPGGGADAGNQQMVEVFSAGNDGEGNPGFPDEGYGTISAEGAAKNVITVGASEGVRASGLDGCGVPNGGANSARDIVDFSSRGPTDDGRLKPDLVAPGTHITGAAPQHVGYTGTGTCNQFLSGSTLYSLISGSSQAAPQVSGAAALVRRWYGSTHPAEPAPSPALTKALLVNTATDLAGGQNGKGDTIAPGPNSDQGWGRVNLGNTFDSTLREYRDQLSADVLSASGQSRIHSYAVQDTTKPVKVTLAWTDVPGPTSGNPVVNNLDLVVDSGGRTYKGNVFDGALSRAGGSADPRNNVESVYLPAGTSGRLGVTVRGTTVVGNGVPGSGDSTDQDFALIVSNADELPPTPVLSGEAPVLSDASPGGDDDGALEPGESFGLDQDIRNGGDGEATGISATMSGAGPLSFSQPASSYPDTAPGASSSNATQFTGALAAGATCGADVTATLSVATDQGTEAIPVVLPTGFAGSASPQSRTHSPALAIPDDSATGLSSTLTISNPGLIKDLDVSISRITHGWVGDLKIQLIGPDGTTVTLAEHPGGPDNSGKNFVDTVFDDEAAVNVSSGSAPYTGSFRPQNDELSRFDGKEKAGNWTLKVRDLFEGDSGTLGGWGTNTRSAVCARNPQTTITAGPTEGQFVESTSQTFQFSATELPGNPPFECRLDGQPFVACDAPGSQSYTGLSQGPHTFEVRAIDSQGDADPSPASRSWFVDTLAPAVDIDQPLNQSTIVDPTPTFTGSGGTAVGDVPNVTVRIRDGGGAVVQTLTPPVTGGTWLATAGALADGNYTVEVEQSDLAGHVGTDSADFALVADVVEPVVSITSPAQGSSTTDTTPSIGGTAGTQVGDANNVTVDIFSGPSATGSPVNTISGVPVGGGAWSTTAPQPLALGTYTVRVSQRDSADNVGESVVTFNVVDGDPPAVTISSPADGSATADSSPQIAGSAGTSPGDSGTVTVTLFSGFDTDGPPVQTLSASRGGGGAWSTEAAPLPDGTYSVLAEQADSVGNVGTSDPSTFTVDSPDPPPPAAQAPTFVLVPAEERLADALAGRLTVLAACASACQVNARLTVSPRAARSLGLGRGSTALGSGSRRLAGEGAATVGVRLTKRARAALRRRDQASANLRVTVTEGAETLVLRRTISLRRSAGLRRIVERGMRLWAVCAESCQLSGKLSMSRTAARRIGLRPRGSGRMDLASGKAALPAKSPTRLTLRIRRTAKTALRKARKVRTLLEAVAGQAPAPRRTAARTMTLRR